MAIQEYNKDKEYKIGDRVKTDITPRYRGNVSFTKVEGEEGVYEAIEKNVPTGKTRKTSTGNKSNTEIAVSVLSAKAKGEQGEEAIATFATSFDEELIAVIIKGFQGAKALKAKQAKEEQAKLEKVKGLGMTKKEIEALLAKL